MPAHEAIDGLLADLQTITDAARTGVLSKRDIVIEPGETRPAAVQFVDVVGFTELSRRLNSEALSKVIDRTFRIFELTVRAHGGYCDKVIGDAALYVYAGHPNYPPVCEAALLAALKLAERVRQVNDSLEEMGLTLAIRQGVAFGNVTRQAVGSTHAQLTVMGETVNIAQRLEAAARPDTIQTTIRVLEKAGDAFIRESLGKLDLKGIGLVTTYNVVGLQQLPARLRGAYLKLTPLIGRDPALHEALQRITAWLSVSYPQDQLDIARASAFQAQRNHLMLISGLPAVGKSRFAYELANLLVAKNNVAYSIGHCTENASLAALTAELAAVAGITAGNLLNRWEDLCQHAALAVSTEYAERQRSHLPLLAYVFGCKDIDTSAIGSADTHSFALSCEMAVRACCELIAHTGKQVVLVLEDLQWLGGLRDLLAGIIARTCLPSPLVIIGTSRPAYLHVPGSLNEGELHVQQLASLSSREGDEIIAALLPGLSLPEHIAIDLHAKSGGIPYYYEDFVRMLIRRKLVESHAGQWHLADKIDELDIPEDLRALMLGRLDQLPEDSRELARRASAFGQQIIKALLSEVERHLGFEHPGHPDTELAELVAEEFLRGEQGERYYFDHALLQEAAYGSLLMYNRVLLHRITAEILEKQHIPGAVGELELLSQLVYHLSSGGQHKAAHERACELLHVKAATLSLEDWDEWVTRAIQLFETGAETVSAARSTSGPSDTAAEMEGESASARFKHYPPSAGLHVALAEMNWRRGNLTLAIDHAQQAISLSQVNQLQRWEAKAYHLLGNLHTDQSRLEDGRVCFERALVIHRETGNQLGEGNSFNSLGILHKSHGRLAEASQFFQESLAIRQRIGDRRGEGASLTNLGLLSMALGRMDEAKLHLEQGWSIFREIGDRVGEATLLNNLGNLHCDQGRLEEAKACYMHSISIRRQLGDQHGVGVCLVNLGSLYLDLNNLVEARVSFEQSLEICNKLGDRYGVGISLNALGCVYFAIGELSRAVKCHTQALTIARELGEPREQAACLIYLSRFHAWNGKLDDARNELEECNALLSSLQDTINLCLMQCSWVYYYLASGGYIPPPALGLSEGSSPAGSVKLAEEIQTLAQAALNKAIALADSMGALASSAQGQEIAKAKIAIDEFTQLNNLNSNSAAP